MSARARKQNAVIDKSSRFPAAKIVPNTSNKAVTGALSKIYADFSTPASMSQENPPQANPQEKSRQDSTPSRKMHPKIRIPKH